MNNWLPFLLATPGIALLNFALQEWSAIYRIKDGRLIIYVGFLPDREVPLRDITRIEVTRRRKLAPMVGGFHISRLFARHVRVRVRDGRNFLLAPVDAESFARELAFSSGAEAVWVS